MNHEHEELVDLGVASVETLGPPEQDVELSAFSRKIGISDQD